MRHQASVIVALAALAPPAAGQITARIGDQAVCARCRIDIVKVADLQSGGGAPTIDRKPYSMAMDSRGRVLLVVDGADQALLYDRDGTYLKTIGHRGNGPGEFIAARYVSFGRGDTAYIFDNRSRRASIFSPAMAFVRSAPMPRMFSAATLNDGAMVVSGGIADPSRVGMSFHLFDRMGNQRGSYGFPDASVVPGESGLNVNWVTASRTGGYWSVSYNGAYTLAQWGPNGDLVQRLERESKLVGPGIGANVGFTRDRPTDPYIRSFAEDREGRIWIEIVVADKDWKRGARFNPNLPGERGMVPEIDNYDLVYDTVIEVIDPRSRSLLVSQRFDAVYSPIVAPDRIARPIVQPDGTFRVALYSMHLAGQKD